MSSHNRPSNKPSKGQSKNLTPLIGEALSWLVSHHLTHNTMPLRCLLQSVGSVCLSLQSFSWPRVWLGSFLDSLSGLCLLRLVACYCSSSPLRRLLPFSLGGLSTLAASQSGPYLPQT
ncbi:hypothetical protein DPMN_144924 [Dreissena polymorpha]|uniref:Uncharacterized protein n=1 Tax=Dreissena polymorpha TaxID=45954 RepID=A0A9D4F414_DREPO|nr:hypothetical protein DPMN_144924 [Dreissena polymorpha]